MVNIESVGAKGTDEMLKEVLDEMNSVTDAEREDESTMVASLASHVMSVFEQNKQAREDNGINELMFEALRAYNGEYSREELALIRSEGGSEIYMNLTSTKCRAAISWIKDILLATKEDAWSIKPTTVPELPDEVKASIEQRLTDEFTRLSQELEGDIPTTIREAQELRRDLYEAIKEEQQKEAEFAFKIIQDEIKDSMEEGDWKHALSQFIDDFCIFPTAVLKGPVVDKQSRLKWENGSPVVEEKYVLVNKRISPFDIYPAPEAESVQDGDFIEHMRMSRKDLSDLLEHPMYKKESIERVLENNIGKGMPAGLDTHVEDEKAELEKKDDAWEASSNTFHAYHYWGSVPVSLIRQWGPPQKVLDSIDGMDDEKVVEVEAILVGSEVIKCKVNKDPLGRRPYYTSSYQKRPGSFWGISVPFRMRDIQRMCNACARALANNMGLSSGPIMEVYIDRLADGQEVSELRPRDILQVTTDPTGSSGRAVTFFTVPSIANELMAVYTQFEQRADDVTMIPRYAYGNERTGGAAQTASGLSMLLESASKGIKDAIRHIDEDVIIPRVQLEFYTRMLEKGPKWKFSGDIFVVAHGSDSLTLKGAEQMRRNEFLQATANPIDQEIMGSLGRAQILRVMARDLGLGENIVPNRQELKKREKQKAETAQQQVEAPVQAAQIQNETIYKIAQERNQLSAADLQRKQKKDDTDAQLRVAELQEDTRAKAEKNAVDMQKTQQKIDSDQLQANQAIALSLQTGDKANNV